MAPPMERWAATATSAGQTGCSHGQTGSSSPPTVGGAPFSVYVPLAAGSNSGSLESLTPALLCISYYKNRTRYMMTLGWNGWSCICTNYNVRFQIRFLQLDKDLRNRKHLTISSVSVLFAHISRVVFFAVRNVSEN